MSVRFFLIFGLCLTYFWGISQREANNWYFGNNAGIQFNADGSVTALDDGALTTLEGCASISDAFGDLLFYTNGVTVWDREHNEMPGGDGVLLGDDSSSQSSIIIPQPESDNIYYIFTLSALNSQEALSSDFDQLTGLNFYTVDINAGTNGEVIHQGNFPGDNAPLLFPNFEKVTAVRSADCSSIWLITHLIDTFYAFEVTQNGVNTTPVTSTIGVTIPYTTDPGNILGTRRNAIGYLKASTDGAFLAIAHNTNAATEADEAIASGVFGLYDFDDETGLVSNEQLLNINDSNPYGVEFSPNNERLYVSAGGVGGASIFQFDLTSTDISSTRFDLATVGNTGALQLGPNGNIYFANLGQNFLSVIEEPNNLGTASNFIANGVNLTTGTSQFGLPPFIQTLFNTVINVTGLFDEDGTSIDDVVVCPNSDFTFRAESLIEGATYAWFFDDGTKEIQLPCDTEECLIKNIGVEDVGLYRIEIDPMNGDCPIEGFGFLTLEEVSDVNDATLVQCDIDDDSLDGFSQFNLEQAIDALTGGAQNTTVLFFETQKDLDNNIPIENPIGLSLIHI